MALSAAFKPVKVDVLFSYSVNNLDCKIWSFLYCKVSSLFSYFMCCSVLMLSNANQLEVMMDQFIKLFISTADFSGYSEICLFKEA